MKFLALAVASVLVLTGCAGQTFLVPVTGINSKGGSFVHASPVFRNTGDMENVEYDFNGAGSSIRFRATRIDNSTATKALHTGLQGDIKEAGSLIFKGVATGAAASVLGPAVGLIPAK